MAELNKSTVIIGGKVYTLKSADSEEYMQKVANYLNGKLEEFAKLDSYQALSMDMRNVLMQINICDDIFKLKEQISVLQEQIAEKDKALYDTKHDLVNAQMKLANTEKSMKDLQDDLQEDSKKIIQMETELKSYKKK